MNTLRMPRIGDRVKIDGFLGEFEIVQIERNGLMVDLKHLGRPGSDYIEKEILTRELTYVDPPRAGAPSGGAAPRQALGGWPTAGVASRTKSIISY